MWFPHPASWWPGLIRLWRQGDLVGLGTAVLFAGLVNLALLATLVWPEAIHPVFRWTLWSAIASIWARGVYCDLRRRAQQSAAPDDDPLADGPFRSALTSYLRGEWERTEQLVLALIDANPFDVEARLLWATLLRHTGRTRAAARQLRRLQRFEAADPWRWEIGQQWEALRQMSARCQAEDATDQPGTSGQDRSRTIALVEQETAPIAAPLTTTQGESVAAGEGACSASPEASGVPHAGTYHSRKVA